MSETLPSWFRPLVWVCFTLFAALAWIGAQSLSPAGGYTSFDARILGYSSEYARDYLALLEKTPGAVEVYLGRVRALDTAFPALLTLVFLVAFRVRLRGIAQGVLGALALLYLGADYFENWRVAGLLRTGSADLNVQDVRMASTATIVKFATLAPCLIAAVWLWLKDRIAASEARYD